MRGSAVELLVTMSQFTYLQDLHVLRAAQTDNGVIEITVKTPLIAI